MTLSKTRWIVRLFFWSLGILDAFTGGNRRWRVEQGGTNLCFFFQTTFVLAPLILLLHLAVYGALLTALTAGPIYFFGAGRYVAVIGAFVLLVAAVTAVAASIAWLGDRQRERRYEFRKTREDRGPSSLGIVWSWLVAQKQKVCPMISFTAGARV